MIARVLGGETAEYAVLMRRHNQRLFRVIRSVIRDEVEAEDVLQEAWVRAYEHLREFEGRSSFATWVTRIAYYEALARARRSKRWAPVEDEAGEIMPDASRSRRTETPESEAMRSELHEMLESAVDGLPEGQRSVFVLREIEQLSTAEAAESLGLSEEAVKTRLHRARALLRRDLETRMGAAVGDAYRFLGARCDRVVARVMERVGQARPT